MFAMTRVIGAGVRYWSGRDPTLQDDLDIIRVPSRKFVAKKSVYIPFIRGKRKNPHSALRIPHSAFVPNPLPPGSLTLILYPDCRIILSLLKIDESIISQMSNINATETQSTQRTDN